MATSSFLGVADEGVNPHEERMQVKRDSPRAEALICSFGWTGPFNEQAWPPFPPLARRTWWMSEDHPHWFPIERDQQPTSITAIGPWI